MAKVKVEVVDGKVDGSPVGAVISIEEKSADYLESVGRVRRVDEPKQESSPKPVQKSTSKPAPKKKSTSDSKSTE